MVVASWPQLRIWPNAHKGAIQGLRHASNNLKVLLMDVVVLGCEVALQQSRHELPQVMRQPLWSLDVRNEAAGQATFSSFPEARVLSLLHELLKGYHIASLARRHRSYAWDEAAACSKHLQVQVLLAPCC